MHKTVSAILTAFTAVRWLAVLLILHAAMLAYGAWIHGPGWDEAGHLPAGISHWQLGNTDLYRVNPPLVRMVATIPLAFFDFGLNWSWDSSDTYARPEWKMGVELWRAQGMDAYWYLTVARWMCIPWSLLAAAMIYRWARELYGPNAALFSALLWCFSPLVLTNAQMMTPDTSAAALGVCATYGFWKWLQHPCLGSSYTAGLLLGLAELSKFTWVVLFGLWPLIWIVHVCRSPASRTVQCLRRQFSLLMGGLVTAVFVINIGYGFEGTFTSLGDYDFLSKPLRAAGNSAGERGNRFSDTALGSVPVPLPRNYVLGIDRQKVDFEMGFKSYLRGQWRDEGWWYYYAYGLLVKEPIGFVVLFGIAIWISLRQRIRWEETFLLAPAFLLFALVSSQTGFNHHLRYVLPCFPFVFIWMGKVYVWAVDHSWRLRTLQILVASAIASSVWVFPHSHAYFNSLVGGPNHGHDHLLDSNIDWGQDILVLSEWAREHPDRPLDGMAYLLDWLIDREVLGLPDEKPPQGYLDELAITEEVKSNFGPQPGRYAVFVCPLRWADRRFAYFQEFEPVEILGYTIHIYELDDEDVAEYWRNRVAATPN